MIRRGSRDSESRKDLTELVRDGSAAHRLARRANALVLLDDGMGREAIAKVLLLDDDTIRTRSRLIAPLHRLGMENSKPRAVSRKLDPEKQAAFIKAYENLLNHPANDEAVLFGVSVRPRCLRCGL
ncbi:MAG: winged helix-turn-helix domain-containing protein [Proteobacteria bacterium]|nr:winged helix-turn-helix domain-containing protein [Pseudomonadota bacterium]